MCRSATTRRRTTSLPSRGALRLRARTPSGCTSRRQSSPTARRMCIRPAIPGPRRRRLGQSQVRRPWAVARHLWEPPHTSPNSPCCRPAASRPAGCTSVGGNVCFTCGPQGFDASLAPLNSPPPSLSQLAVCPLPPRAHLHLRPRQPPAPRPPGSRAGATPRSQTRWRTSRCGRLCTSAQSARSLGPRCSCSGRTTQYACCVQG